MFSGLIGNDNAKQMLGRILSAGRLPNALLLAGPEGVGKKQFALDIAKSFVCRSHNAGPCRECSACVRVGSFTLATSERGEDYDQVFFSEHPDVGVVIPFRRNLRVGAIRDLEKEAYFRPYEAEARFFVVDDAHKMNDAASNALLKTLEEPASTSFIFLITSRPDALLATIRSRCQTIRFGPVDPHEIGEFLRASDTFDLADAPLAARLSGGSVGRALSIDLDGFRERRDAMLAALENLVEKPSPAELLGAAESMNNSGNKDSFEENLNILVSLIHDVWLLRLGAEENEIANIDAVEKLKRYASIADNRRLAEWMRQIDTLREGLAVNINKKIAADSLFMQMAAG